MSSWANTQGSLILKLHLCHYHCRPCSTTSHRQDSSVPSHGFGNLSTALSLHFLASSTIVKKYIHCSQGLKSAILFFLSCVRWWWKARRWVGEASASERERWERVFSPPSADEQSNTYHVCFPFPQIFFKLNIKIFNSTKEPNKDYDMTGNSMNSTVSYTTMVNSHHSWLFPSPNYKQWNHKTHVKILSVKVPAWEKFRNGCTKQ